MIFFSFDHVQTIKFNLQISISSSIIQIIIIIYLLSMAINFIFTTIDNKFHDHESNN
jgi:hypothetical protein